MSFISLHDLNKKPQARTDSKQFVLFQQRFHICFFLLWSYWTLLQKIPLTQLELYLHQAIAEKGPGDFPSACSS